MFWNLREEARLNPETHLLIEAPASETKIIDESELEAAKAMMTEADYLREYECSFDASVPGTYFANLMNDAYHENRIGDFPAQSGRKVEAVADLGYTDSTSWWLWQTTHEGYRVVLHYEDNGREIQHYIDWLKSLPYDIDKVWLPHDAKAKSLQTGRSIIEVFLKNGIRPSLVPELSVQDGIEAARQVIPKCVFDESACYEGTEHLRGYRRSYDEKTQTFRNRPRHDEHSHSADSFRYLALSAKNIEPKSSTIILPPKVRTRTMYEFTLDDLWKDCGPRSAGRIGD
jgi:phage terminase large subunit